MGQRKESMVTLAEAMGLELPRESMSANEILGLCIEHAKASGGSSGRSRRSADTEAECDSERDEHQEADETESTEGPKASRPRRPRRRPRGAGEVRA